MQRASILTLILAGLTLLTSGIFLWLALPQLDLALFQRLRLDAGSHWVAPVQGLTTSGGFAILGPLALAVIGWLWVGRRRAEAVWLLVLIGSGRLAVEAIKELLARPRPPLVDRLTEVSSQSFPSSHSAGTLLTWVALAMLFPALRLWMLPFALAMAAAIGWSRIALGVHWPSDVLAGYGLALLWVGIAERWRPRRSAPS